MTKNEKDDVKDALISCAYCMEMVPLSEAHQAEGEDYVMYFCGLDCFAAWRDRADQSPQDENGD